MKEHPLFEHFQTHQWRVWGNDLFLNLPSKDSEVVTFVDTRNREPGKESVGFYDDFYDLSTKQPADTDETDAGQYLKKLESLDGERFNLLCTRRRFINTFYPDVFGTIESFFADVWVVRNYHQGDLHQATNLQAAELDWINLSRWGESEEESADDEDGFLWDSSDDILYTGLNWRQRTLNNTEWQIYDEHNNEDVLAQVWLYPLGPNHYLKLRFYRMRFSRSEQFRNLFIEFCEQVMAATRIEGPRRTKIEFGQTTTVDAENFTELSVKKAAQWSALNEAIRNNRFQPELRVLEALPSPEKNSKLNNALFYGILLVGLLAFIFVIIGALNANDWFEEKEIPHASIITTVMALCALLWKSVSEKWRALRDEHRAR